MKFKIVFCNFCSQAFGGFKALYYIRSFCFRSLVPFFLFFFLSFLLSYFLSFFLSFVSFFYFFLSFVSFLGAWVLGLFLSFVSFVSFVSSVFSYFLVSLFFLSLFCCGSKRKFLFSNNKLKT